MHAADALGSMAALVVPDPRDVNHEYPAMALSVLLAFYRDRAFDRCTGRHLPLDFRDLAGYHVSLSALAAIARARSSSGFSPDAALDLLLRALVEAENRSPKFESVGERPAAKQRLCGR
jgi:hypothetical protein